MIWPFLTFWPILTIGFWFRQVRSLRPTNLRSTYSSSSSDLDALGIDVGDRARLARRGRPCRELLGDVLLQAGGDDRRLGDEQRHRLPLHVRTHQRAVGVVVLEERDQPGRDADHLLRATVDVLDLVRRR